MQKCRLWLEIEISCILMQNLIRWILPNPIFIQNSGFFTVTHKIFLVSKFDLKQIYTISRYFLEKKNKKKNKNTYKIYSCGRSIFALRSIL